MMTVRFALYQVETELFPIVFPEPVCLPQTLNTLWWCVNRRVYRVA